MSPVAGCAVDQRDGGGVEVADVDGVVGVVGVDAQGRGDGRSDRHRGGVWPQPEWTCASQVAPLITETVPSALLVT